MNSFIGEIKAFPYNFVPVGWLECNGQILNVRDFQPLFAILGFTYGGNFKDTFALPNMQGLCMVGEGKSSGGTIVYRRGPTQPGSGTLYGSESVTLNTPNLPLHTHNFIGKGGAVASRTSAPGADNQSYLSNITYKRPSDPSSKSATAYLDQSTAPVLLNGQTISGCNGNMSSITPHENRSPYLAIRYCICVTDGDFPIHP